MEIDANKVISIVKSAGKIINYNARFNRHVEEKGFANYVTDLDKQIEEYVISRISDLYPDSVFLSEETKNQIACESFWVLDPIDGTTNLIHKYNSSCISLAYVENNMPVLSIVYCPNTQEMFYAEKGNGAFLRKDKKESRISVNKISSIQGSLIGFGLPYDKTKIPLLFNLLLPISEKADDIKRRGPASLDICYVACGRLSAYFELDLEPWDFAAGKLILEEAGGIICDFDGNSVSSEKTNVIASNKYVGEELIKIFPKSLH